MKSLEYYNIIIGIIIMLGFISCSASVEDKKAEKTKKKVDPKMTKTMKENQPISVEFKSLDGLLISGNLYEIGKDKPVLLLCHQATYNKWEYEDIAPRLNELGYNCLAIDQRSGGDFAGKPNETYDRAKAKGLATEFIDAQQDIKAAITFLSKKYEQKIIIWGSSYSASLVLFESLENKNVAASISFSPGDYFGNSKPSIATVFPKNEKPFLITSSKREAIELSKSVIKNQLKENQIQFVPASDGFHGSKALWVGKKGAEEYWSAIIDFLKSIQKN